MSKTTGKLQGITMGNTTGEMIYMPYGLSMDEYYNLYCGSWINGSWTKSKKTQTENKEEEMSLENLATDLLIKNKKLIAYKTQYDGYGKEYTYLSDKEFEVGDLVFVDAAGKKTICKVSGRTSVPINTNIHYKFILGKVEIDSDADSLELLRKEYVKALKEDKIERDKLGYYKNNGFASIEAAQEVVSKIQVANNTFDKIPF